MILTWLYIASRSCAVGFEHCPGCLKETLEMVSELFHMCAGSKCMNWKGIIFYVTERS